MAYEVNDPIMLGINLRGIEDFMEKDWLKHPRLCPDFNATFRLPLNNIKKDEMIETLLSTGKGGGKDKKGRPEDLPHEYGNSFTSPLLRILSDDKVVKEEQTKHTGAATPPLLSSVAVRHFNGYENQAVMMELTGTQSWCSMQKEKGSANVGKANIFVSWALSCEVAVLTRELSKVKQISVLCLFSNINPGDLDRCAQRVCCEGKP
jgi:hypothetical protein